LTEEEIKERVKGIYINELMRRIDRSGTLDVTSGTVHGFPVYTDDDPVVEFNKKKNDYEIAGKEWQMVPKNIIEYINIYSQICPCGHLY
jgi:hypothetical protein